MKSTAKRLPLRLIAPVVGVLLACQVHAANILVDFGDTSGATTSAGGDTWNTINGPVTTDLLDTSGASTTIDVDFLTGFAQNNPGSLTSPSPTLLGDFAVASATRDYFFTTGAASFRLQDLDTSSTYNIRLFGTRDTTSIRETLYTVTGAGAPMSQALQTSGAGSGAGGATGNNNDIVSFVGVSPDANDEITITYEVQQGGFGYLGVMGIEAVPIPEPASVLLVAAACLAMGASRRRR